MEKYPDRKTKKDMFEFFIHPKRFIIILFALFLMGCVPITLIILLTILMNETTTGRKIHIGWECLILFGVLAAILITVFIVYSMVSLRKWRKIMAIAKDDNGNNAFVRDFKNGGRFDDIFILGKKYLLISNGNVIPLSAIISMWRRTYRGRYNDFYQLMICYNNGLIADRTKSFSVTEKDYHDMLPKLLDAVSENTSIFIKQEEDSLKQWK